MLCLSTWCCTTCGLEMVVKMYVGLDDLSKALGVFLLTSNDNWVCLSADF